MSMIRAHLRRALAKSLFRCQRPLSRILTALVALRAEADQLLKDGTYGKPRKPVIVASLTSSKGTYKLLELHHAGEVADLYLAELAGERCLLKIVRAPSDNDLLDNEARVLHELHARTDTKSRVFQKYLPRLRDTFALIESGRHRRVNVLDLARPEDEYLRKLLSIKGVATSYVRALEESLGLPVVVTSFGPTAEDKRWR